MKETAEAEELDERDDEDEDEAVPVESESYVNLRKKMVTKHSMKMDNLLQENGKLCREFQKKQVKKKKKAAVDNESIFTSTPTGCIFNVSLSNHTSLHPVIQAFQVHVGAEEETASLARKRKHPRSVRPVPGAGGQRDDRVGHTGQLGSHSILTFFSFLHLQKISEKCVIKDTQ